MAAVGLAKCAIVIADYSTFSLLDSIFICCIILGAMMFAPFADYLLTRQTCDWRY